MEKGIIPPISPCPSRSSDPMQILRKILRHVKIDHCLDPLDIQSSRRQICRQQEITLAVPELFEGFESLFLGQIAVKLGCAESQEAEYNAHLMHGDLGPEEDDDTTAKGLGTKGDEDGRAI